MGIVLYLASCAFYVISYWAFYGKMEEPGWKCLVPFYGEYTLFKRVWKPVVYAWYLIASILFFFSYMYLAIAFFAYVSWEYTSVELPAAWTLWAAIILAFGCWLALLVIYVMRNWKIAKCFGHGVGYCLGITFLPVVFVPILAFGSDQYVPTSCGLRGNFIDG